MNNLNDLNVWFCGLNRDSNSSADDPVSDKTCFSDALNLIVQLLSIIIFLVILLIDACTRKSQLSCTAIYPAHSCRWLTLVALQIVHFGSLAEGILTDSTFELTKPHLYLPQCFVILATLIVFLCLNLAETSRRKFIIITITVHWIFSLVMQVLRLLTLLLLDVQSLDIARFYFTGIAVLLYGILCLLNLLLGLKICTENLPETPENTWDERMYYNSNKVNILSKLTYWWLNWLPILGYKRLLTTDDLGVLPESHNARRIHEIFKQELEEEQRRAYQKHEFPSLWRVCNRVHGRRMISSLMMKIVADLFGFVGPLALGPIIVYVSSIVDPTDDEQVQAGFISMETLFSNGFVLVGVMFIATVLQSICQQTYEYWVNIEGLRIRSAIQTAVFEKSLRLSTYSTSGGEMTMGQITNHMSTDATNMYLAFQSVNGLLAFPIQVIINLVFLYLTMGCSSTIGASVFVFTISAQLIIARCLSAYQVAALNHADHRLKKCNEVLQGMKLLKLLGWQDILYHSISKVRRLEIKAMASINAFFTASSILTDSSPLIVTMVAYGTYHVLTGNVLKPDVALPALALFNIFQQPIFLFPINMFLTVNGIISAKRIQKFLNSPELKKSRDFLDSPLSSKIVDGKRFIHAKSVEGRQTSITKSAKANKISLVDQDNNSKSYGAVMDRYDSAEELSDLPDNIAIKVEYGSFAWNPQRLLPILSDINIEIPRGKLTIVVGEVGSGKSSMISAILGEMTKLQGHLQLNRHHNNVALACQNPWLINKSLRENILFGQPFHRERYQSVLEACALLPDIDILPGKDMTEIGEKGINLSGGQKQRISVARAVYSCRDIIILDDPMSALDVHVAAHLFENAIMHLLVQQNSTVILVTHQIRYLARADQILVFKNGRITYQGTPQDMKDHHSNLFTSLESSQSGPTTPEMEASGEHTNAEDERRMLEKQVETLRERKKSSSKSEFVMLNEEADDNTQLIEEEEIERGSVSYKVFLYYFSTFGFPVVTFVIFFVCYPIFVIGSNFWLVLWANAGISNSTEPVSFYVVRYATLCSTAVLCDFVALVSLVWGAIRAAEFVHRVMLRKIIQSPMRFFDITPIGRIINRFSSDTQIIDTKIQFTVESCLFFLMSCIAASVVNVIISPYYLMVIIPTYILCYFIQRVFITSSRELQRLDNVSKSPVFSHFSETLGGLQTIRAYRCQQRFYDIIMDRVGANNTVFLYLQTMNRWLAVRLDFLGAVAVLFSGIITVTTASVGYLEPGYVGLAIAYALQVACFINLLTKLLAELEMQMNSMERVKHYIDLPTEPDGGLEPPPNWPPRGLIEAQGICVRYAPDTDTVLKDVSFTIKAGQKIGVCGRTGSGKSSLALAFFRIIETYRGRILIDNEDIGAIRLTTLRNRIAIIPQDPTLFSGTIRFNLDPEGNKSDDELWIALVIAQLKDVVLRMKNGLDSEVVESGGNFSVGQRQLFCLARAFLGNSQVLIMDEATASIDHQTVQILHDILRTAFAKRTVITIAHRVATILDSDAIFVLKKGQIVENGPPQTLLADTNSLFYSLVQSDKKKSVTA